MISSTPENSKKAKGDGSSKTPLRRSLFGMPQTPYLRLEKENDDMERSQRRSLVNLQRRISTPKSSTPDVQVGDKELKMHFDICLKMFSENKINAKNVWNLKIIDYIKQIVQTSAISRDSLQVGSVSLDVGAKVYGIRVDDVHAEGLKLASNMSRIQTKKDDEVDEDVEPGVNENEDNPRVEKKKKKRRMCKKNTLSTNEESLFAEIPKIKTRSFQTNTNPDLSAIDNYFTNSLPTDCTKCKWVLTKQLKAYESYDDPDPSITSDKYPIRLTNVSSFEMCKDFQNFDLGNWDPETDDVKLQDDSYNENVLIYDNTGVPVAELDGSLHDIFAAPDDISSAEEDEEFAQIGTHVPAKICDVISEEASDSNDASDYLHISFLNPTKRITNLWAGPSHWKMKHVRRTQSRFSGISSTNNVQQQPPKKRPKLAKANQTPINFEEEMEEVQFQFNKNIKLLKLPTEDKYLLPPNFSVDENFFRQLSFKKGYLDIKKKVEIEENEVNVAPYDYDNANDSQYCPDHQNDNDSNGAHSGVNGDMEMEMITDSQANDGIEQQQFLGNNLIDLPELVPRTQINFASKAKKMDMKKLKLAIWKVLARDNSKDVISPNIFEKDVHKTNFLELYKKLPSLLNVNMREEISSHLAFIALLHLANEHNLKLTSGPDKLRFIIEKDHM